VVVTAASHAEDQHMNDQVRTVSLLLELRDLQQAQLATSEQQAARSIALAEESLRRQVHTHRIIVAIAAFAAIALTLVL